MKPISPGPLNHLETFLRVFGFCQYSFLSIILSWLSFLLLGIALPAAMIKYLSYCTDCEKYQINTFEIQVLVFQSLVATISLVCISHSLRKYGARKFLFVDRYHGHLAQFRDEYVKKINGFFRLLVTWVLPFLVLKIIREAVRVAYAPHHSWGQSVAILIALVVSWTLAIGSEYFFVLELLVVTASQIVAIFQTTWHSEILNLINGGDFVISSIVELVGSEAANPGHLIHINYSESDLEAVDYVPVPTTTQLASYMSTYHKRQSFVTYLQSNPGGFSVFGWRVDRTLINTIFFLEISLVLFVLGKTITIYHS
ncbi:hypothetical protein OIU77_007552 [Salix suchowensis]|uniref:Uncharacterized protein n=1 Tax=Salix suchowensis TaxID=1278906 RepID=A0ABQ9AGJ6_9ROSI|nr:hypothetical protein OIU77_007552 [Salix suchowensis]